MGYTDTQREGYACAINSGLASKEEKQTLKALKEIQPCTRLQLHRYTKIPISNLCRVLYDLRNPKPPKQPLVEVIFKKPCPTTCITVQWYEAINKEE